jgi:hypothetical protein
MSLPDIATMVRDREVHQQNVTAKSRRQGRQQIPVAKINVKKTEPDALQFSDHSTSDSSLSQNQIPNIFSKRHSNVNKPGLEKYLNDRRRDSRLTYDNVSYVKEPGYY